MALATSAKLMNFELFNGNVFDGRWIKGSSSIEIKEPATGKSIVSVGVADASMISRSAQKALIAQKEWAEVNCEDKRKLFIEAERVLRLHAQEVIDVAMREIGATRTKAEFEIEFSADEILEAASYPTQQAGTLLADKRGRHSYSKRVPYGVVAALTPSNVPILLAARVIAPALAMGNAVLLKPHPHSILCGGYAFARIFEEAGFPEGVIQVLPADGADAQTFETDKNISMVHFTGSSATGARIAELASKTLKKVSISGSGKNPFIVLDDVPDLDAVVSNAIFATFYFGGQSCMTAGRHLVQQPVYEDYISKFVEAAKQLQVGNPVENENVFYGPMIDPKSINRLSEIVEDAVKKGAELVLGGSSKGTFFEPTILKNVTSEMRAWQEEMFGPIAAVTSFTSDEDAVEMANDTEYGLSGAVFGSLGRARNIANRMNTGMVHINDKSTDDSAYVPFGGTKQSGNGGRYGSYVNWDEYTQMRWFTESVTAQPLHSFKK